MDLIVICVIIVNAITFLLFGVDKWSAKKGRRRVSERTLLLFAAIGGSFGAYVGMWFFRHKTKKVKFYFGVPLIFLLQVGGILWMLSQI